MKLKLKYWPNILIIIILSLSSNLYAEEDDTPADSSSSGIALDAIHIDLTSIVWVNYISIIADIELTRNSIVSFGLQPSYGLILAIDPFGSSTKGRDISLLTYFSLGHNFPITLKATLGFSYLTWKTIYDGLYDGRIDRKGSVGGLKYGIAAIINISRIFKIHAKLSRINDIGLFYGIGFSVGWSR